MQSQYTQSNNRVNTLGNLTIYNQSNNLRGMNFGERLIAAMAHKGIDQTELAKAAGASQPTIHKIVSGKTEASTFTVQLAVACGVRPEWLAMEDGEMVDGLYVHDERLKHALKIMEQLPEYAVDDAIKDLDQMAQLIKKATAEAKK